MLCCCQEDASGTSEVQRSHGGSTTHPTGRMDARSRAGRAECAQAAGVESGPHQVGDVPPHVGVCPPPRGERRREARQQRAEAAARQQRRGEAGRQVRRGGEPQVAQEGRHHQLAEPRLPEG